MKYPYTFIEDPGRSIHMDLPEEVWFFADFISTIMTVAIADEVLGYIDDVMAGKEKEIELTINAPTVIIRPEITKACNELARNSDEIHKMETEAFRKLVVVWKEKKIEEREERRRKEKNE